VTGVRRSTRLFATVVVCIGGSFVVDLTRSFVSTLQPHRKRGVTRKAFPASVQSTPSLDLIKKQKVAGPALNELGTRLQQGRFEATALDGRVRVSVDGHQEPKNIEIAPDALDVGSTSLAQALLRAMQEAHEKSQKQSADDVWALYRDNPVLLEAPLTQIGPGSTVVDLWENVTRDEETLALAAELFEHFDADGDGFWNRQETSNVQMATSETEMSEDSFVQLILTTAPEGGRFLSEEDLQKGLSREKVVDLYTDREMQRRLGFVLDVRLDHATVFFGTSQSASTVQRRTRSLK